jgi:hypothetical protein
MRSILLYVAEWGIKIKVLNYNLCFYDWRLKIMILVLFVDNLLVIGNHVTKMNWLKTELGKCLIKLM